jgi:hypothetical protein
VVADGPEARLRIENSSNELLEVVLEWYGRDYWLKPDEVVVVTTVGNDGPRTWSGTTRPDEPFEVDYHTGSVTVHFNGDVAWVTDADGHEIECGHQRPEVLPR